MGCRRKRETSAIPTTLDSNGNAALLDPDPMPPELGHWPDCHQLTREVVQRATAGPPRGIRRQSHPLRADLVPDDPIDNCHRGQRGSELSRSWSLRSACCARFHPPDAAMLKRTAAPHAPLHPLGEQEPHLRAWTNHRLWPHER